MNTKIRSNTVPIVDIHQKIVEIKKKIQLSEGQKKAIYEEYNEEKNVKIEEISRLKKEISQLLIHSRDSKSNSAKNRIKSAKLKDVAGPLIEKNYNQLQELLDLQVIDKVKQLDLVHYQLHERQKYLANCVKEHQDLLAKKDEHQLREKVEIPLKKKSTQLQNNIQSIDIQWKESLQVCNRYKDIKRSLQEDSTRFEYQIKLIEDELRIQEKDINRLSKITEQAMEMKSKAYTALIREEKTSLKEAKLRSQQEMDGKRLIQEEKQKLDILEKSIFPPIKTTVRENDDEDEIIKPKTPPHPSELLLKTFEQLKLTTGSTSPKEVLERFQTQKNTSERLTTLRNTSEDAKRNLDKKLEVLNSELEKLKLIESKCLEKNAEQVEAMENKIIEYNQQILKLDKDLQELEQLIKNINENLTNVYSTVSDKVNQEDPFSLLHYLKQYLTEHAKQVICPEIKENGEENLLSIYSGLLTPSPFSQTGPPQVSEEEEEEVPTRGYLKRQGQLVIDTKTRRKTLRMLMNRRNITQ